MLPAPIPARSHAQQKNPQSTQQCHLVKSEQWKSAHRISKKIVCAGLYAKKVTERKRKKKSAKKGLCKCKKLWYSISEADRRFRGELTRTHSAGANRWDVPHKQGFSIGWTDFAAEETQTNMYRIRKRNFVIMFLFPFLNDHGLCCCLAKVVHGELCENFLVNEVHLFWMKMQ